MASRGAAVIELSNNSNLALLNEAGPTRNPSVGPSSSPDLTIVSPHLAVEFLWSQTTALSSDHRPIMIKLAGRFPEASSIDGRSFTTIRRVR